MSKRKARKPRNKPPVDVEETAAGESPAEGAAQVEEADPTALGAEAGGEEVAAKGQAVLEPPEAAERLMAELAELKDRHLRVAAEYENFRKRTARERHEIWIRAQGEVVSKFLDSIDDLGRVAHVDPEATQAKDILQGVELVERKLLRELESAGLKRVGSSGEKFDPNHHEAIGTVPAESPEDDQVIHDVIQIGYKFGGDLLRPARVRVRAWTEPDEDPELEASQA